MDQRAAAAVKRRSIAVAVLCLLAFVVVMALLNRTSVETQIGAADQALLMRASDWQLTLVHIPLLILLGLAAGVLSGFLGMGGGVVQVALLLIVFDTDMAVARAVTMMTMFLAAVSAVWQHRKAGIGYDALSWPMLAGALGGMSLGLAIGFVASPAALKFLFGFFLFFLGVFMLTHLIATPNRAEREAAEGAIVPARRNKVAGGIGALHGLLCGLLGISGGVVTTPMQQMFLNSGVRRAIVLSLVLSVPCTLVGAAATVIVGATHGDLRLDQVFVLSGLLGGAAVVGSNVGARLAPHVNKTFIAVMFAVLYFVGSITILT